MKIKKPLGYYISLIAEYLILLGPSIGYISYIYDTTLKQQMSTTNKATFIASFVSTIVIFVFMKVIKVHMDNQIQIYNNHVADLEKEPDNQILINLVSKRMHMMEQLPFIYALLPIMCFASILWCFQYAFNELVNIIIVLITSIIAKIGYSNVTSIAFKQGLKKKADKK